MAEIIAVAINKGGVGKTSLTANLAAQLAVKGNKVLIIDTDAQGNIGMSFGINTENLDSTLYSVLIKNNNYQDVIVSLGTGYDLDLLPSNSTLDFFDMEILSNWDRTYNPFYLLDKKLANIREDYDYIIIDTPPAMGLMVGNVLSFADKVLIPFEPESGAIKGLIRLIGTIEGFKEQHNEKLEILGMVPMKVDMRTNLHRDLLEQATEYAKQANIKLFNNHIPRSIQFASAVAYDSLPAVMADKTNTSVNKYRQLTREILKEID